MKVQISNCSLLTWMISSFMVVDTQYGHNLVVTLKITEFGTQA